MLLFFLTQHHFPIYFKVGCKGWSLSISGIDCILAWKSLSKGVLAMTRKKKFIFTTKTVLLDGNKSIHFQSQCRSGGGGNGRCGGGKSTK